MLLLGIVGCQQAQEQPAEQAETHMEETMPMDEQMTMMDPVCGMEVSPDTEWTAEYEGQMYYFCSEQCRDTFMENPMEYLEPMAEEGGDM
jgi:YHS domain-containing protein